MRKQFFLLTLPLLSIFLLIMAGCEKEEGNPAETSFITIDATIAEEDIGTRALFPENNEEGKMDLRWENNDELQLCFIHQGTPYKKVARTTSISADGKKATFQVEIPQEIISGTFDLYGVTGGAGLMEGNPRLLKLYDIHQSNKEGIYTHKQIQDENIPALTFERKGIVQGESQPVNVDMRHLGWMVALHIKNNTGKVLHLKPAMTLQSTGKWIYDPEDNSYDLVNGKFSAAPTGECLWTPAPAALQDGEIRTYWQWICSEKKIPDLELALYDGVTNNPFAISGNVLRKREIKNGNAYHFYQQFEGEKDFNFTRPFSDELPADISNGGDPYFTMDDIEFWVGAGEKKAALVIQWHDGTYPDALVWGYKWEGEATGADMINEIAKADPLLICAIANQWGGKVVGGIGYNINKTQNHYLIVNNETDKPRYPENGFVEVNSPDFDHISYSNPAGHWQSGWYNGYWSYFVKDNRLDAWEYSSFIATMRNLENGSWDGWSFLDDMDEWEGRRLGVKFTPALPD